jgi:hypothetical protein
MIYRNTKTGVILESVCQITGGDWEPVKAPIANTSAPAQEKETKKTTAKKTKA